MAQIVHITAYREKCALQAGFKQWRRCFKEEFSNRTRLNDLSSRVLCRLADPAEPCEVLYYPLILGFLGHGAEQMFASLENRLQMQVVDIHLFLADQVRFEMMRRLGWLARFGATEYSLFEMVRQFEKIRVLWQQDPPLLAETHFGYAEYKALVQRDQQVFIRRLFPSVLEAFQMISPG
ncbi:MAG: hypothetical protein WAU91_05970 [Desulfatitalea sp.]